MERLKKIIVKPGVSIKQALKQMDEAGEKILFVGDDDNRLLGVVTDGDIRKWIIDNRSLSHPISKVMNKTPIYLKNDYSSGEAKNLMLSNRIECLPVLDKKKKIISAIWWLDLFQARPKKKDAMNIPVVIMAGGEGTRLAPFTKILPKPLMPVGDKTIIEMIIDRFAEYGCKEFYLSLNYKSNLIKAYFSDFPHDYKIHYLHENKPLGTAGSLSLLKGKIKSTFCVSNCDILIDADYSDIMKFHKENGNMITMVGSMKHFAIPYGVCKIHNGGKLKKITEKPEFDFLVNTGMYMLEPAALDLIPPNRFYHITDLINGLLKKGKNAGVYPVSEKSWLDMGQWEELQETLNKFEAKRNG